MVVLLLVVKLEAMMTNFKGREGGSTADCKWCPHLFMVSFCWPRGPLPKF